MNNRDRELLRRAIDLANQSRKNGDEPFGAVLGSEDGEILAEALNSVHTDADPTAHAETNLIHDAVDRFDPDLLETCTLYASTEPCPMCAGTIFWSRVGRLVYGLDASSLPDLKQEVSEDHLSLTCEEVLASGGRPVTVEGPTLEEEAREVFLGYWDE